jgi:hypothetical protein
VPALAFDFDARKNLCGDTLEPSEEVRFDDMPTTTRAVRALAEELLKDGP